jgi:hypothetical protein
MSPQHGFGHRVPRLDLKLLHEVLKSEILRHDGLVLVQPDLEKRFVRVRG